MRLFLVCAIVLLVFALIASVVSGGLFLTAAWPTWAIGALIAWALDQLTGYTVKVG